MVSTYPMNEQTIHFVTGRLAERALREIVGELSKDLGFEYSVGVLPITVAALMTPSWIARHLEVPSGTTRIMLPGYCHGDLTPLREKTALPLEVGPRDLRKLPLHFGLGTYRAADFGEYSISIIGEINEVPRLDPQEVLCVARAMREAGADLIDVGCLPGEPWKGVRDCVKLLIDDGHRVSIDSFDPGEVAAAVSAGAELVLSVNRQNREAAVDWGCEVVVIPDDFSTLGGLAETLEYLASHDVPLRIDPILEPIGCGFADSLRRYHEVRQMYPDAEMMMGIGNLTELTDVDSAGINVLLLGICEELGIRSVLTTQVINWSRTSIKECDLARRLVYHAVEHRTPPKRVDPSLVVLRDANLMTHGSDNLQSLARQIKDRNLRVFAEEGQVHLIGSGIHVHGADPFEVMDEFLERWDHEIDASHAFYLGYELSKAHTAVLLGKEYVQDEPLDWGYLTDRASARHRLKSRKNNGRLDS